MDNFDFLLAPAFIIILIALRVGAPIVCGIVAHRKSRYVIPWVIIAIASGLPAIIAILLMSNKRHAGGGPRDVLNAILWVVLFCTWMFWLRMAGQIL